MSRPECRRQPMAPDPNFSDLVGEGFFGPGEWSHWKCVKCGGGRHISREAWGRGVR